MGHADVVVIEVTPPVAWLRLCRPEAMNALDDEMLIRIDTGLDELERDDAVRVVVVTGTGRAFCAGADLKSAIDANGEVDGSALLAFVRRAATVVERLAAFPKPVIAAVNGLALAGGFELALACDLVLAASSARLGDGHATFGLLPGAGGAARLARIAGPRMAKQLAFTGEALPAADLVACGLVNEVVPDDTLEKRTLELASQLAEKSPLGLARMKRLIDDGLDRSLGDALAAEYAAMEAHVHSDDMREGLAAFMAKRQPTYVGR